MNNISLVFICDNNYVLPTKVAIKSLIVNSRKTSNLDIYVICVDVVEKKIFELYDLTSEHVIINIIKKENTYISQVEKHLYVSEASLFKFQLPNILNHLDKVLYLDSDIIVNSDLFDLFNFDIEDNYAGVCKDYFAEIIHKDNIRLGHTNYFNSGMMLLNLKKMRTENLAEKLLAYKYANKSRYMDQDSFNAIFCQKVSYVTEEYNFFSIYPTFLSIKEYESLSKIGEYKIIHFANDKPWENTENIFFEDWFKYLQGDDYGYCLKKYFLHSNEKINELENKYTNQINELENKYANQINELENKYANQINELENKYANQINEFFALIKQLTLKNQIKTYIKKIYYFLTFQRNKFRQF